MSYKSLINAAILNHDSSITIDDVIVTIKPKKFYQIMITNHHHDSSIIIDYVKSIKLVDVKPIIYTPTRQRWRFPTVTQSIYLHQCYIPYVQTYVQYLNLRRQPAHNMATSQIAVRVHVNDVNTLRDMVAGIKAGQILAAPPAPAPRKYNFPRVLTTALLTKSHSIIYRSHARYLNLMRNAIDNSSNKE